MGKVVRLLGDMYLGVGGVVDGICFWSFAWLRSTYSMVRVDSVDALQLPSQQMVIV